MISPMQASISALGAFGIGMQATANNIANVNTAGFKSSRVDYETGPAGQGVNVGAVSRDPSTGPAVPALPVPVDQAGPYREGSNVSLEREFTTMIALDNGYSANAVTIRSMDNMLGSVMDMLV